MKKNWILLSIAFLFLLLVATNINASIDGSLTSWRADNISGWACDTENSNQVLNFNFIFKDKNLDMYNNSMKTFDSEKDPAYISCKDNKIRKFSINLYDSANSGLLTGILNKYPIYIQLVVSDGQGGALNLPQNSQEPELNFSCTSSNQTILKLTKPKNSHVYLGNQSTLLEEEAYPICYNRIFGYDYAGTNPIYPANCINPVLYKNKYENSHSGSDINPKYPLKICYGDLVCASRQDECQPSNNESEVVRLYKQENSHVSDSSDKNYQTKICCKTSYIPPEPNKIESAIWNNMYNNEITFADKEDYVKMVARGSNLNRDSINFSLYNSIDNLISFERKQATKDNSIQLLWITLANSIFKFNAMRHVNLNDNKTSKNLLVSDNCGTREFNISVISPKCGADFKINEEINFIINITTPNLYVSGQVLFSDGTIQDFNNSESNIIEFKKMFSQDSVIKATILAQSQAGPTCSGSFKRKFINIIIIDREIYGKYAAACIDSPEDMSTIRTQKVLCNASSSRAIENNPSTGFKVYDKNELVFKWVFNDGINTDFHEFTGIFNLSTQLYDTQHNYTDYSGKKYTNIIPGESATKGWLFTKYLRRAGDHSADLSVSID